MTQPPVEQYRAFLVRWWSADEEGTSDRGNWRFSLEEVGRDWRFGFLDLQQLSAYLDAYLCSAAGASDCPPMPEE